MQSVVRWFLTSNLTERPATIFDLAWSGSEQQLVATVFFATDQGEPAATSAVAVTFHDVFAIHVADEFMDEIEAATAEAAKLDPPYPNGGAWPFLEVRESAWVRMLTERDGAWHTSDFRHWVVTTRNTHLHVACRKLIDPVCKAAVAKRSSG